MRRGGKKEAGTNQPKMSNDFRKYPDFSVPQPLKTGTFWHPLKKGQSRIVP
jgi:hypothetical protein